MPVHGPQNASLRDISWLNSDRLILVALEGYVSLVSPRDILQQWDLRRTIGGIHQTDVKSRHNLGRDLHQAAVFTGEITLNVVATHQRGFVIGGNGGHVVVFEQDRREQCAAGGGRAGHYARVPDSYVLTRVIQLFAADVVELQLGEGVDPRWVSASHSNSPRPWSCVPQR